LANNEELHRPKLILNLVPRQKSGSIMLLSFTLASDQDESFRLIADEWFGDPKSAHVDAWLDLSIVDEHQINFESFRLNAVGADTKRIYGISER
jgi:hypothetical protein